MQRLEQDREFNLRIKHNFKLYILLTSKERQLNEDAILEIVYRLNGYKRHKTVKYGQYTSHIHVKFEEEYLAKEAVDHLNRMNSGLTAVLVDDMLRNWFAHEIKICGLRFSLAIVDIVGNPPFNVSFLKNTVLNPVFENFGAPCLLAYKIPLKECHVQVMFHSMTEAFAACIFFGEWYNLADKVDCFFFRVRIIPSDKEEILIRQCEGTPSDAFKLDYFLSTKAELKFKRGDDLKKKRSESKIKITKCENSISKDVEVLNSNG